MRKLFLLILFLPLYCSAQTTGYQYTKDADTTLRWQAGKIILTDTTITINNTTYTISNVQDLGMDNNDQYWSLLTLNNGLYATIRRYSNQRLMNVIVQGGSVDLYYYLL